MYLELIAEVCIYDAFNKNVHLRKVNNRGGRSANKFRKSQIRKLVDLHTYSASVAISDLRFGDPNFFADLKLP
jgi:hypothetical protein